GTFPRKRRKARYLKKISMNYNVSNSCGQETRAIGGGCVIKSAVKNEDEFTALLCKATSSSF
ncbi:hypothetical protein, partial [Aggregatibacter actinomycetemcomitans]|uniref:hypothetical protein n=1 Tax=Aggregatibacter actinomycetemcomitans TaxID=714 RepID=UPI00197BE04C